MISRRTTTMSKKKNCFVLPLLLLYSSAMMLLLLLLSSSLPPTTNAWVMPTTTTKPLMPSVNTNAKRNGLLLANKHNHHPHHHYPNVQDYDDWTIRMALTSRRRLQASKLLVSSHHGEDDEPDNEGEHDEAVTPSSSSALSRRARLQNWWRQKNQQQQQPTTTQPQIKNNNNNNNTSKRKRRRYHVAMLCLALFSSLRTLVPIQSATASAPVMALPKAEGRDPTTEALTEHERGQNARAQAELRERDNKAREIERTQGEAARVKFEQQWQAEKEQQAAARLTRIANLKKSLLLEQGICPFSDLEGIRQVTLAEKGVDLGEVSGTPYALERDYETKKPQKSMKVQKQAHRQMIKCIAQDMDNRGVDPVTEFQKHRERTLSILNLPANQAVQLAQEYSQNLEQYGQITVPKEGEVSVKDQMAAAAAAKADPKVEKARIKAEKEAARAEQKAAKEQAKAEAKAKREQEKAEAKAAKEEAKARKEAEKQEKANAKKAAAAAATTAAGAAAAAGASAAGTVPDAAMALAPNEATAEGIQGDTSNGAVDDESNNGVTMDDETDESSSFADPASSAPTTTTKSTSSPLAKVKTLPLVGGVVVLAGGGYALKMYRDKAAADEAERQRQFKLLMGEADEGSSSSANKRGSVSQAPALEEVDTTSGIDDDILKKDPSPAPAPAPPATEAPSKKRRLGIFNKKKSNRETNLDKLVAPDAPASKFSMLLAKTLTYGAPGRFPKVEALDSGSMPMEGSFDLDLAKQMLTESRVESDLSDAESAEVFANVVNCMLIDMVDLASTSLKEKDPKVTVDAISIVVEFMNHAASLYDAVAGDASINPVVYEGSLAKSKLEQMYSAYASSAMLDMENLPDDFDSRVSLLQDVFQINEKKAEGLMMKAMQKQMMEAMKDPKAMQQMMENMGGMEGMEGMADMMGAGGADGMDTEQLMEMMRNLKEAKDRGEISGKDLDSVRDMFKETFGSSIESLDESSMSDEDKEVLAMMRQILDD